MIGPAELREFEELLDQERDSSDQGEGRSPYLTPQFAVGLAMTRAAASSLKSPMNVFQFPSKR